MTSFVLEFHDATTGDLLGGGGDSTHFGGVLPRVGDVVLEPLSKKHFGMPRDVDKYYAFEILKVCFIPHLNGGPLLVKALATQRRLSEAERAML